MAEELKEIRSEGTFDLKLCWVNIRLRKNRGVIITWKSMLLLNLYSSWGSWSLSASSFLFLCDCAGRSDNALSDVCFQILFQPYRTTAQFITWLCIFWQLLMYKCYFTFVDADANNRQSSLIFFFFSVCKLQKRHLWLQEAFNPLHSRVIAEDQISMGLIRPHAERVEGGDSKRF